MSDVICAGILVADTFCGPMQALPAQGQLLAVESMPTKPGGCAANVAIDLARHGLEVDVVGCLGRDAHGQFLAESLSKAGALTRHITYADAHPTSTTVILLVDGQDRRYVHCFGANRAFSVEMIDRRWLAGAKIFYLGGLFAMPGIDPAAFADLLAYCRQTGVRTVVDHQAVRTILPYVDVFLPNEDEARLMTGRDDPRAQVQALLDMGAATVVVTRGGAGSVAGQGRDYYERPAFPVKVVDPSGSGDAFASGMILGTLRGWDFARTLRAASAMGASAARAVGTTDGVFNAQELDDFLRNHP